MFKRILLIGLTLFYVLSSNVVAGSNPEKIREDVQSADEEPGDFKVFLPLVVNSQEPGSNLSELPLSIAILSKATADYFNQIARPDDIAAIPTTAVNPSQVLPLISAGQIKMGYASWAEAEQELDGLLGQIDIVSYNPEHWNLTPIEEQQNLVATVQQAADFAHARGLVFMVAPDLLFAEQQLAEIAPYADVIGLQGQELQGDPQTFETRMTNLINVARASNPNVEIHVQVGATHGTAEEMLAAIETISDIIDGIAVWSAPETLDILQEFVSLIRES
jgi:hypothetical protein